MRITMGCSSSSETDPNVLYADQLPRRSHNVTEKQNDVSFEKELTKNGHNNTKPLDVSDKSKSNSGKITKTMKGDITLYSEAKIQRQQNLKLRQRNRENKAQVMAEKAMEEKEMLSLVSSRSRGNSRATSPGFSRKASGAKKSDAPSTAISELTDVESRTMSERQP